MAMKKSEMEAHHAEYEMLMDAARQAERDGFFRTAVELALSSCDNIDGMMQYKRKYEDAEFNSIRALDVVLSYAPLLLDYPSLDTVESLLKDNRRIERYTSENMIDKLADARALMWDAHRLWDHLESQGDALEDELCRVLEGTDDRWRLIIDAWEHIALVSRVPERGSYRLALCTRMGKVVSAKCASCGAVTEAPKAMFLEKMTCHKCRTKALFVILAPEAAADVKE